MWQKYMNSIVSFIGFITIITFITLPVSAVACPPNCQTCLNTTPEECILCEGNYWGSNCNLTCQCLDGCDIKTGICYHYIKTDNSDPHLPGLIAFVIIVIIMITILIIYLVRYGGCEDCCCCLNQNEEKMFLLNTQYLPNPEDGL